MSPDFLRDQTVGQAATQECGVERMGMHVDAKDGILDGDHFGLAVKPLKNPNHLPIRRIRD